MGINRRNLELVIPFNSRRNLVNVNEKVRCKKLLEAGGIPVPRTLAVCASYRDVSDLSQNLANESAFAIKPGRGYGGEGILLITDREESSYRSTGDDLLTFDDICLHISQIIDGVYSLDNYADQALIEELIIPDPAINSLCGPGVPDIRIIVFRNQIIGGMLRLPTAMSGGKANLHQGGVGVGIDIESGLTTTATVKGKIVSEHPDTRQRLAGLRVPYWEQILEISPQIPDLVGLGYVGIDYVVDQRYGMLILEVNGRPGLQIQMANMKGLRSRFQDIAHE